MWMTLASGHQVVASANADDAASVAPEEASDASLPFDGKVPTPQQILEMLDSLSGISDEEKATLREDLLKNIQQGGELPAAGSDLTMQTVVLLSLLALVALIFANMAENTLDSSRDQGILSESVQEKLLQLLPEDSREQISGFFQRYQQLDEEEKHEVMEKLVDKFKQSLQDKLYNELNLFQRLFLYLDSYTIFFFALLLVVLVLVFFVYKLFKCLSEREMKREEKKKMKQMKKKK